MYVRIKIFNCINASKNDCKLVPSVPGFATAKVETIKKLRFKLLCIVNYKVNFALFIVNFAIPSAFKSLSAIIF